MKPVDGAGIKPSTSVTACGLRNRTKNKINLYITIPYLQSKIKKHIKTPPCSYYVSYILKLPTCR